MPILYLNLDLEITLSEPPPPKNSKFEPLKMARAYVYLKVSEYPPQPHGLTPSSPALCSVIDDFPLGGIMKL